MTNLRLEKGHGKWILAVDPSGFCQAHEYLEDKEIGTECEIFQFSSEQNMLDFIIEKGYTLSSEI